MVTFHDERTYEDGDLIVSEGETGAEMFVIQSGRVAVTKKTAEGDLLLATLERGDFFGEMSLLESQPRSATVRAVGPTKLLAIRSGELLMKIRRDPTFAFELLQRMSGRIRVLDEEITRLSSQSGSPAQVKPLP
jgi:CRP-like cAMP-binding protein